MAENKLNIFQKIQKVRVELQKRDIKKTGLNKYSNYSYFELSDFLPHVNELCEQFGLYTEIQFLGTEATLEVFDVDSDKSRIWKTPVENAALKGCSAMQSIGASQSYARRYLYVMGFEIAESDMLDGGAEIDVEKEEAKKKINKPSVMVIKKLVAETGTDINKFLDWAGVKKVEDITNEIFGEAIKLLESKKKAEPKKEAPKEQPKEEIVEDFDF